MGVVLAVAVDMSKVLNATPLTMRENGGTQKYDTMQCDEMNGKQIGSGVNERSQQNHSKPYYLISRPNRPRNAHGNRKSRCSARHEKKKKNAETGVQNVAGRIDSDEITG